MAIDSLLRPFVDKCEWAKKIARSFAASGISPNFLTLLSFFFAALAGLSFFFSGKHLILLLLAGISICLNALLDTLDGILAREIGNANKKGDFLDHVFALL
ncbi:MAG TPA: CDP-alcohol phosphatidyltransferase family protein [Methanophagales archaeon]|nr:CDP-alcohol phosphatidyltransferase family protein [Methanophagales archaeon]